jgi:hypothetical protein
MIIGLLGAIGSGKNTVAKLLVQDYGFRQESFAGSLKDATANIFGWPRNLLEGDSEASRRFREEVDGWWSKQLGIPNFTPRLALQLIGTDVFRDHFHKDIWFLSLMYKLEGSPGSRIVVSDARFPNEIKMINDMGGYLLRVDRGAHPAWWFTAIKAYNGDEEALHAMRTTWAYVHESEWAWAGCVPFQIIDNNYPLEYLQRNTKKAIEEVLADKQYFRTPIPKDMQVR